MAKSSYTTYYEYSFYVPRLNGSGGFVDIFQELNTAGHEQVVFCSHPETGLRAIISLHSTILGPALGGCRLWPYKSDREALADVLRLSRGMTYKAASAGLDIGGGKSVIIADPSLKGEALFRSFGRFVDRLNGLYVAAQDVNISVHDMAWIQRETDFACGGGGKDHDPSPYTSFGACIGIQSCLKEQTGSDSLVGKTVAIQGVGSVGRGIISLLEEKGIKRIFISDVNGESLKSCVASSRVVEVVDDIFSVSADIFCPCALGGIVNEKTIEKMNFSIVAGAANNQLLNEKDDSARLAKKGIIYAPDYVINAGGLIAVSARYSGKLDGDILMSTIANTIDMNLRHIFQHARDNKVSTIDAAHFYAEKRINNARGLQAIRSM